MEFKQTLKDFIKSKKPHLSDSSVKTYVSNLSSINKKLDGEKTLEWYKSAKKSIINFIENDSSSKQSLKTYLSALYILTGEEEYKTLMITYCNEVNDKYKQQRLTEKQAITRISFDEVKLKYENCLSSLKANPTFDNFEKYFAAALSSGVFIPPRRSELANVKIHNFNKETDNYLQKNIITFNVYKTVKKYGKQTIVIPTEVMVYVRKYLKINKSDFLFPNSNRNNSMSNSDYTKLLNKVFGPSISVDALRSIWLSEKYKNIPKLEELQKIADQMGHTVLTGLTDYVKH